MTTLKSVVLIGLLAASHPLTLQGQPHRMDPSSLGVVKVQTSCTQEAEAQFETGLALLHHMMYEQAADAFTAAATADSACAMAHWGVAMSQLHPLWAPPTEQAFQRGRQALQAATAIDAAADRPLTKRERGYLSAMKAYYDGEMASHTERLGAWEKALKRLHEANPEDVDAGAFYALAHLAVAPPTDKQFAHQRRAGALLERLHERAPHHPGVFHYLIHAYDNPVLAERAVEVARGYHTIAPSVPHALHMPSHIFVRLGVWPEVAAWNARSAEAARQQPVGEKTSMHHAHAMDYRVYAYLQQGLDRQAKEALDEINAVTNYQDHFASAYGVAAAPARYSLERGDWTAAARLPVRPRSGVPWDTYPHFEAITYFARGLGAARSGDLDGARRALDTLDALHERTVEAGEAYWAVPVAAQRTTVAAWIAHAEGRHETARSLMQEAAELEDSVDKHPVTPGAVRPARELLGDMLVLLGQPAAAMDAYRTALGGSPSRLNSLYGLGRAAELAGDREGARAAYEQLVALSPETEAGQRTSVAEAKAFLARN